MSSKNKKQAEIIQKAFKQRIKLEKGDYKKAFKGKVTSIRIKPKVLGSRIQNDLEYIIYNSYLKAKQDVPKGSEFNTYAQVDFKFVVGGDDEMEGMSATTIPQPRKKEALVWAELRDKIFARIQSNRAIDPKSLNFTFHFINVPSGGSGATVSREKLSILNKTSVNKVLNDDNNCFWYALVLLIHRKNPKFSEISRGRPIRAKLAKELCEGCGMEWDKTVSFDEIPLVEQKLNVNILIFDIDAVPVMRTTTSIYQSLIYKNSEVGSGTQYYLLHDSEQEHYHAINNIKGFLAANYFCPCCLRTFHNLKGYKEHQCQECDNEGFTDSKRKKNSDAQIGKDLAHYLHEKAMLGGKDELKFKMEQEKVKLQDPNSEESKAHLKQKYHTHKNRIEHQKYIIYDLESDVHTDTHKANHVEADVLVIGSGEQAHNYDECLKETFSHNGYDAVNKFCNWLFTDKHRNSTVIAHNQAGYDGRFILQWCLKMSMKPDKFIRQGNRIMYMSFKKLSIRFVDSMHFFLEGLRGLSKSYGIDTLKGDFPHKFNKPENQDYVGPIPDEGYYGVDNMSSKAYESFKPWHEEQVTNNVVWDFQDEIQKYCRADTELLSKSVLKFRKMFKDKLDIDPWRYITLASLCMSIFRGCFLPEKSIVANEQNKPVSRTCQEWLTYLNDKDLVPEVPITVDKCKLCFNPQQLHKDKLEGDETIHFKQDKHIFVPDALDRKRKLIKEFNGCYFHGCPKCHPECQAKYNRTMERKNLLELQGYKVESIWGCEWEELKKTLPNKAEIETAARQQNIKPRQALCGGRTEAFKSHVKCNEHQKIFYLDVVSLYPTVNALDDYAVGFRKYVDITVEDIVNDKFIGLVKCDVVPPKNLYKPVLPDNTEGKLLFHLNPMYEKVFASVELKKALEKGYEITKIHSATEYKRYNGLMRNYVGNFIKMKIENSGVKTQKECDEVNEYHKRLGFDFEIKPENTVKNPGLRQVAKICLNSLWGKFGQRTGMDNYAFYHEYNKMVRCFVNDNKIVPQTWNIIDENCVELRYMEDQNMSIESDYISEITAVFTTANARVRLYNMLDWLDDSQLIYCDTDSVVFLYDETNPNHKSPEKHQAPKHLEFGKGLGQWEDEFDGKDHIVEIVCGGAKSYTYKTAKGETVVKQKGITLDRANEKKVNFETLRDMVLNHTPIQSEKRFQFKWETETKNIITKYVSRSVRSTLKEKRTVIGYDSVPLGFEN